MEFSRKEDWSGFPSLSFPVSPHLVLVILQLFPSISGFYLSTSQIWVGPKNDKTQLKKWCVNSGFKSQEAHRLALSFGSPGLLWEQACVSWPEMNTTWWRAVIPNRGYPGQPALHLPSNFRYTSEWVEVRPTEYSLANGFNWSARRQVRNDTSFLLKNCLLEVSGYAFLLN